MGAVIAFPSAAEATFPGQNGRITFVVPFNTIATINPDGSGRIQLGAGWSPAWSPDGGTIAFDYYNGDGGTYADDLGAMNPDGTNRRSLLNTPWPVFCDFAARCSGHDLDDPAWSPLQDKLVFVRQGACPTDVCDENEVFTANLDGPRFTRLAPPGSGDGFEDWPFAPTWSPDGSLIAYYGVDTSDLCCVGVMTIRPDGTDPHLLFEGGTNPSWSPHGTSIAANRSGEIFKFNRDGTGVTQLTSFGATANASNPVWSPDGTKIAFVLGPEPCCQGTDIYVMNADGTNPTNITNSQGANECCLDWQPLVGYARPKAATPTTVKLVPAYEECVSSNASHGAPLALPSCNPPDQTSDYLTIGTPDSNGAAANSTGFVKLRVYSCPMCAPPFGTDVFISASLSDVRKRSDSTEYTGELQGVLGFRATDRLNGSTSDWPGTVTDAALSFPISCAATSGSDGSTCSVETSANAIMPGLAVDGKRAVWGLSQVQVYDGGSDGDADTTGDNTLFAVQGLFAP